MHRLCLTMLEYPYDFAYLVQFFYSSMLLDSWYALLENALFDRCAGTRTVADYR